MRILYLSCHAILEYDEVSLLHELGHEVFSPGAYVKPANPGDASLRPGIPGLQYDPDLLEEFHQIGAKHPGRDAKDYLTKEFVDKFDCVIVMHLPRWVRNNWQAILGKRVIWRTIGQSISDTEKQLASYRKQGMQIIRYSPMERNIPSYIGEDALIRFYKNPNDYGPWEGTNNRVITFGQHMKQRGQACSYNFFEEVTRPFPRHLFGPGNEGQEWTSGKVPFHQLKEEMRLNRVYFYTGTHPASYTLNFIEAFMSGIPIVAIGLLYGNAAYFHDHNLYEVPYLLTNEVNGFISDDPLQLQEYIKTLLGDYEYAKSISVEAREKAIELFGKDKIKEQWKRFLDEN